MEVDNLLQLKDTLSKKIGNISSYRIHGRVMVLESASEAEALNQAFVLVSWQDPFISIEALGLEDGAIAVRNVVFKGAKNDIVDSGWICWRNGEAVGHFTPGELEISA